MLDHAGRPAASIGVTFYRSRVPPDQWSDLAVMAWDAARTLTIRLSGRLVPEEATDGGGVMAASPAAGEPSVTYAATVG